VPPPEIVGVRKSLMLLLGVQLCFRRFPIDGLAVSGDRNK